MFSCKIDEKTELRLINRQHAAELFQLLDANRQHLRWHPWVEKMSSVGDVENALIVWENQIAELRGFYTGIWFERRLCGMINFLNVDWTNRWTAVSYWLDAAHQGRGIMTACCRRMIFHGFKAWKFNRITIECASDNARSRAIPERLGFKLEGVIRGVEWLHDHFADHAVYGMLSSEYADSPCAIVRPVVNLQPTSFTDCDAAESAKNFAEIVV